MYRERYLRTQIGETTLPARFYNPKTKAERKRVTRTEREGDSAETNRNLGRRSARM